MRGDQKGFRDKARGKSRESQTWKVEPPREEKGLEEREKGKTHAGVSRVKQENGNKIVKSEFAFNFVASSDKYQ